MCFFGINYIFLNYHKKTRKKLIIRLKINVLFIEIIKSKAYLRYIWDDKKITIKSIYKKKIIDLVFLNFKCSMNAFRKKKIVQN